ncbi:MAG TPA: hypothetical protein VFE37_22435 [Chloroflexota bacterium]|nr:hypothetical protein [Chloroflexota bacterium]
MLRTILATAMVSSILSASLTALTLGLAFPPASRAEPTPQDLTAGTLRVQQIVLVDANGTPRGTWGVGEDGAPTLSLRDPSGRVRAFLTAATDMVGLVLNGAEQSQLSLTADGTINVGMADRAGRRDRFFVGLTAEGTPAASMSSADGRVIWSAP